MIPTSVFLVQAQPRAEGWFWWLVLVGVLVAVLVIVGGLRRRLLRPMRHTPSDTTDAWIEAGRRLDVPPDAEESGRAAKDEEAS